MECSAYSDLSVNGAAALIRRNAVLATDINLSIKCIKNINFHYENRSPMTAPIRKCHCVKYVQIQGFLWSVFSRIRTECGKVRTRKNSVFGHFSRSVWFIFLPLCTIFYIDHNKEYHMTRFEKFLKVVLKKFTVNI